MLHPSQAQSCSWVSESPHRAHLWCSHRYASWVQGLVVIWLPLPNSPAATALPLQPSLEAGRVTSLLLLLPTPKQHAARGCQQERKFSPELLAAASHVLLGRRQMLCLCIWMAVMREPCGYTQASRQHRQHRPNPSSHPITHSGTNGKKKSFF